MATTAPALLHNLTHMHHFRSNSDGRPHKLHKHKSHPHLAFTETGKTEEFRDDLSSQSSSNDAKSDLSRKGSVKRTVKKVKKYLTRRFSGHHHHHVEGNYSVISGGLVGAQFAYAALGRPASTPSSPSGGHSDESRFIHLKEEVVHHAAAEIPVSIDNDHSLGASTDGFPPLQPMDMEFQTPDHSFESSADQAPPSEAFDQSFDSIDSRAYTPLNDSFELPDINIPVPDLPPSTPDVSAEKVSQEVQTEEESPVVIAVSDNEIAVEPSGSVIDGITVLDSVESLRSLDDVLETGLESEPEPVEHPIADETGALAPHNPSSSIPPTTDTANVGETEAKEVPESPQATHISIPATVDDVFQSLKDSTQSMDADASEEQPAVGTDTEFSQKEESMNETGAESSRKEKKTTLPTAYVPYDDSASEMSFDMFDVPYFKATVVALAASGLGVLLASGAYRLLRSTL